MKTSFLILISAIAITSLISFPNSIAEEQNSTTEIIPIDGIIGVEKTIVNLNAPSNNILPWGFVEGKIGNFVPDYPVIIQIYDDDGEAVHFAQTEVDEDGNYEYRFRVFGITNDEVIRIFDGDYEVKIFKVIYLNPESLDQV